MINLYTDADSADKLIFDCESMGLGLDINILEQSIKIKDGRKTATFKTIEAAQAMVDRRKIFFGA